KPHFHCQRSLKDNIYIISRVTFAEQDIAGLEGHLAAEQGNPVPLFIAQVTEKTGFPKRFPDVGGWQSTPPLLLFYRPSRGAAGKTDAPVFGRYDICQPVQSADSGELVYYQLPSAG